MTTATTLKHIITCEFIKDFRRYCIKHEHTEPQSPLNKYQIIFVPAGSDRYRHGGIKSTIIAPNIMKATIIMFDNDTDGYGWTLVAECSIQYNVKKYMYTVGRKVSSFKAEDIPLFMRYLYADISTGEFNKYYTVRNAGRERLSTCYIRNIDTGKYYSSYKNEIDVDFSIHLEDDTK